MAALPGRGRPRGQAGKPHRKDRPSGDPTQQDGQGQGQDQGGGEDFHLLPMGLGWEGSFFNGEAGERLCWLLFFGLTYRLAFGRNDAGEYYAESGINGALDMYGRGYGYQKEPKKTRAVLRANVAGVTVARRSARRTTRKLAESRRAGESVRESRTRREAESVRGEFDRSKQSRDKAVGDLDKQRAAKRGRDKAEARSGLQNLGFGSREANALLAEAGEQPSPEAYIQEALKIRNRQQRRTG